MGVGGGGEELKKALILGEKCFLGRERLGTPLFYFCKDRERLCWLLP